MGDNTGDSPYPERAITRHQRLAFDPRTMHPDLLAQTLPHAQVTLKEGEIARITTRVLRLDRFAVTFIKAAEGRVVWRPRGSTGTNRFMFLFVARGRLSVSAKESSFVAADEAFLVAFPGSEPITLTSASPVETVAFTFDAEDVAPLELTPDAVGVMRPSSSVFLASYSLLRALVDSDENAGSENTSALRNLLRGTARGLLHAARVPRMSLQDAAVEIMAEQHTNAALDAHMIAAQLNVSVSTLYRAFSDDAPSLAEQLRRYRIRTAVALQAENPDISLSALSAQSGFGSVSSLRRGLKDAGGPLPL